jgi:hypothetical protein
MMKEITPVEKALFMLDEFQKKIELMKAELAAFLPSDDHPVRDWITDPLTGQRRYIKKRGGRR